MKSVTLGSLSSAISAFLITFFSVTTFAIASSGDIYTYAGLGYPGYTGDGGPAVMAELDSSTGVAVDRYGNVYIADTTNNCIRMVDPDGNISTVAGKGVAGYTGDTVVKVFRGGRTRIRPLLAVDAALNAPSDVVVDAAGNMYIADTLNNRIRKVDASGNIYTLAGTGNAGFSGDGGPADSADINAPEGVAVDGLGNVYFSDTGNNRIRVVDASGLIHTVAGNGIAEFSGDGGPATGAGLNSPARICADSSGNIYIADRLNNRVRAVDASGTIRTVAGTGAAGFSGDGGPAVDATLAGPAGIALDPNGDLYIADSGNRRVREVGTDGIINTFAGGSVSGVPGDGGSAADAGLGYPAGLALDDGGDLYVVDTADSRVRMVEGVSYALPISAILDPLTGHSVDAACTVRGVASAKNGVAYVQVSTDGGMTWNTASGGQNFEYGWTPPTDGAYYIVSRSVDVLGNVEKVMSVSDVSVTMDTTAPASSITSPAAGASLTGDTFTVTGTATDGTGSGVKYVEVSSDGGVTWSTATGTDSWSFIWAPPAPGGYVLTARAADNAGNVETPSGGVSVTVTSSTPTAPPVTVDSLTSSAAAAFIGDSVTWTATASGGTGTFEYRFLRSGPDTSGPVLTRDWAVTPDWTWTVASGSTGTNYITVEARNSDGTGTAATYTSGAFVVYDPVVVTGLVANPAGPIDAGGSVTWTASATGGTGGYLYRFLRRGPDTGGNYVETRAWDVSPEWVWTTDTSMAGSNDIRVEAGDLNVAGGLANIEYLGYNVNIPATGNAQTTLVWTPSTSTGVTGYKLYVGTASGAYTTSYDTGTATSYTVTGLTYGTAYYFATTAYGADGVESGYSNEVSGTLQETVYVPVSVTGLTPDVAGPVDAGASVTWTATAVDGSGSYRYRFLRSGPDTGGTFVEVRGWDVSNTWTWNTVAANEGGNDIRVEAGELDGSGTVASMTYSSYTVNVPTATTGTGQATLAWTASLTSGVAGYKLYVGTSPGTYTMSYDAGAATSYTVAGLTSGATYYFATTAYDTSGVESGYSNEVSGVIQQTSTTTTQQPTTLAWDRSTSPEVVGYKVRWGTEKGVYTNSLKVGDVTSYTFTDLPYGSTVYFTVSAYDTTGTESVYSNSISKTIL